jgi:hypothetical protein
MVLLLRGVLARSLARSDHSPGGGNKFGFLPLRPQRKLARQLCRAINIEISASWQACTRRPSERANERTNESFAKSVDNAFRRRAHKANQREKESGRAV